MSAYEPPTIISTIYNPSFFETSIITPAQASGLYLKKNTPDTATALETFSVGIATNSLNTTSTASNLTIGTTSNTGSISIETASILNALATPAIAIGTSSSKKTISIGNSTGVSNNTVYLTSLEVITSGGGVEINNGNVPMFIGNKQTSTVLNLGAGTGGRALGADVNIANRAGNACAINIMNGNTTAGSINLATGTGVTQTTAVNIASGSSIGQVTIGNASNTVQINGNLTMGTGKNITLQPATGYVNPISGMLGFSLLTSGTATALGTISGTTSVVATASSTIPIGTYMIHYASRINSSGTSNVTTCQSGLTLNGGDFYASNCYVGSATLDTGVNNLGFSSCWVGKITSVQTILLKVYIVFTGSQCQTVTSGQGTYINIVRIA